MVAKKYEIDMSKGSIFKNMIAFAIPLMFTNILQLLYNAADTIVVGRWGGPECLAAVGATGTLTNLMICLFVGLSIGVSVAVSKRYGAGDIQGLNKTAHTGISMGLVAGVISMVICQIFCRPVLELMGTPEDVIDLSVLYMRILFLGVPAQMVFNFGAAILRSVGDTRRPLYILSATGIVNVGLNLILVIGFHMNVAGVAIATAIAHYLSAGAVMYTLLNSDAPYKINPKKLRIHKDEAKDIISIGIPAGVQSAVFSLSNLVIQSSVNSFGTATMAGRAAASNIEGFVYTSMNSFYQATMTSVSQNYGAKKEKRIYKSIWTGILCSSLTGSILGGLVCIFAKPLLSLYITESPLAQEAMREGVVYIMVCGVPYFLCGMTEVLTGVLRGLGHSKSPAFSSLIATCGFRMLWVFVVLPYNRTTWFLYLCWPLSWILVIIMHSINFMIIRKKTMEKMYANQ